jgi:hypothetical protein
MRFSFKINDEFLELPEGTTLQLEQNNHLLNLGTELVGEYSLPFTVRLTDTNARLLGNLLLPSTEPNTSGIDVQLWFGGLPHSSGLIKIERKRGHYNFPLRGSVSLYYVFKQGSFWQLIKDKTLRDINYGAAYSFPWEGFLTSGPNTGFIGHVTDVMNNSDPAAYDYAFFPVVNELGLSGQETANCIINCCAPMGADVIPTRFSPDYTQGTSKLYYNQYSPFPYHRFIIQKLFSTFGWNITGAPLLDADFLKTTLIHSAAIPYQLSAASGSINVTWDFKTMLPKLGLGNYLVSLANKFGWWFDFDDNTRTLTVSYRKDILAARKKVDYTGRSGAIYDAQVQTGKIYRMEHAGATEKLDFTYLEYQGEVNTQYDLPAPIAAMQNHAYLVKGENAWYICTVDTTNVAKWEKSSDNLPNYEPDNTNDAISTNMQLPGTVFIPYRNTAMSELTQKVVLPLISLTDGSDPVTTFYTAYYHGVQQTINDSALGNYAYPYGAAGHYAANGTKLGNYALSWQFANGTADEGLYIRNWKTFLNFIKQTELVTVDLLWNIQDVLEYRYQNTILIRNTEYLVSKVSISLPLTRFSQAELIRVV